MTEIFDWSSLPSNTDVIFMSEQLHWNTFANVAPRVHGTWIGDTASTSILYAQPIAQIVDWENETYNIGMDQTIVIIEPAQVSSSCLGSFLRVLNMFRRFRQVMFILFFPNWDDHTEAQVFSGKFLSTVRTNAFMAERQLTAEVYFIFSSRMYELYTINSKVFFKRMMSTDFNIIDFQKLVQKLGRRSDFEGVEVPAMAKDDATLGHEVSFEVSNSSAVKFKGGSAVEIYWCLRDLLNFTEKALLGSFDGTRSNRMLQQLKDIFQNESNRGADLSISQVTYQESRAHICKFLQPTSSDLGITAIFTQPPRYQMRNIFMAPFENNVWSYICVIWLALVASMTLMSYRSFDDKMANCDAEFRSDSIMWAFAAISQKAWPNNPISESMRIVFLVGFLLAIVIYVAYSATIISILTIDTVPVNSLRDLLSYKYVFYAHKHSNSVQTFLQDTLIPTFKLSQTVLVTDTEHEVRILQCGSRALLSYMDAFYFAAISLNYSDQYICDQLSRIPLNRRPVKYAMFVRIGSPFREIFDQKIMTLKERGLNHRYITKYALETQPLCARREGGRIEQVEVTEAYSAFAAVAGAYTLGLFLLALEIILWKHRRISDLNHLYID